MSRKTNFPSPFQIRQMRRSRALGDKSLRRPQLPVVTVLLRGILRASLVAR